MLRETVGDEMFWKALNRYLTDNQYKNVVTSDLQCAFEETTGQQLDWFFNQWVYKAGYPELRVRSFYSPASRQLTLTVTQTQRPDATTPEVFRLPVDIELATAGRGARSEHLEITQRTERFTFQLDGRPLMIRFDKGEKILKKLDFPRTRGMLAYQMQHSSDIIGRSEAAASLARLNGRPATKFSAALAP
jgi:aminopeptidase N